MLSVLRDMRKQTMLITEERNQKLGKKSSKSRIEAHIPNRVSQPRDSHQTVTFGTLSEEVESQVSKLTPLPQIDQRPADYENSSNEISI